MKNRIVLSASLIISLIVLLTSCSSITGTGPMVTEARQFDEIASIDLEMNANLYLIKGDTQSVVIKAQQNILDVLKTEYSSGKLEIKSGESISVLEPVEIWITLKTIEDIELSGSGSIVSTTEFNSEKINTDLSGSGKISLVVNSAKLTLDLSGSGDIYLKGKIAKGNFDLSGSGNIIATTCEIDNCKVDINGSGSAKILVASELNASIDGSGEVQYSGNPHKVKSDVNGSGRIIKIE